METLPVEMVLKISHQLTPEDLAHCCAVSRGWREEFDNDLLWKRHCDPEIEEHLRTTPSIVEPVFVTPGGEDSTLAPISQWRLAFLKEKHLLNNWKNYYCKSETLSGLKDEVYNEFLTCTLIVRWCENHFEIWDVSVIPAVFVAKTDPSLVDISEWIVCSVAKKNLLVVEQIASVNVFYVDVLNKCIDLKHDIPLDDVRAEPADYPDFWGKSKTSSLSSCINGSLFVNINVSRSNFDIFDLETGVRLKEEPCPVIRNGEGKPKILAIKTSKSTDYLVVAVEMEADKYINYHYIYSLKTLCFLPGPIVNKVEKFLGCGEINQHYYAIRDYDGFLKIYDCRSGEMLLESDCPIEYSCFALNDSFIVKETIMHDREVPYVFRMFSPSSKTSTILQEFDGMIECQVINNKLLVAQHSSMRRYFLLGNVWFSDENRYFDYYTDINRAFAKVLSQDYSKLLCGAEHYVDHYW